MQCSIPIVAHFQSVFAKYITSSLLFWLHTVMQSSFFVDIIHFPLGPEKDAVDVSQQFSYN